MAAIGRVLLIPKGDYSGSATYNMLDWVRDNGAAWVCKVDNTVGVAPPTLPATYNANWQLIAADGTVIGSVAWASVNNKPFDDVDTTDDFKIDSTGGSNELQIKRGTFGTFRVVSDSSGSPTTTDLEASGDAIIKLKGGSNVTLSADDSANPKEITINSTGGGGASTFAGLGDVSLSGTPAVGQIVQYTQVGADVKLRNVNMPTGGHTMIDNSTLLSSMNTAINEGTSNDDVVSAYGVGKWSNVDRVTIWTTIAQNNDTIGAWNDNWKEEVTPDRTGWIYHTYLAGILTTNDVDLNIVFDPKEDEVVTLAGWRIDDNYTYNGVTVGCIAIKLNAPVKSANGVKIGVVLDFKRTEVIQATTIPS